MDLCTVLPDMRNHIGTNIRRLRFERHLSQKRLAKLARVSRSTVAAIEGGTYASVRSSTLNVIAKVLGVSPGALMEKPAAAT